jgi:hypothetical protein
MSKVGSRMLFRLDVISSIFYFGQNFDFLTTNIPFL